MALEKHKFQSIENLYEDLINKLKKSRDMKLSTAERAEAKEMMTACQADIDSFLPTGMTDQEKKSLRDNFQRLIISERDQNADINLSGYPEKIDKIFPGFAAYKKEQFAKALKARKASAPKLAEHNVGENNLSFDLSAEIKTAQARPAGTNHTQAKPTESKSTQAAPVQAKPAEVVSVSSDPKDIAEFGKEEAEYLAKMKTDMVYAGKLSEGESFDVDAYLERYRQVLRNKGPVDGVEYKFLDTYLMYSSPQTISKTMRRDGDVSQKPSVDDVMQFLVDVVYQGKARERFQNSITSIAMLEMMLAKESKATPEDISLLYDKLYENYKRGSKKEKHYLRDAYDKAFPARPEADIPRDTLLHKRLSYQETVKDDPLTIRYSDLSYQLRIDNDGGKVPDDLFEIFANRGYGSECPNHENYKEKLETLGGGVTGVFNKKLPLKPEKINAFIVTAEMLQQQLAEIRVNMEYESVYKYKKCRRDYLYFIEALTEGFRRAEPDYVFTEHSADWQIRYLEGYILEHYELLRHEIVKEKVMDNSVALYWALRNVSSEVSQQDSDYWEAKQRLKKEQDEMQDAVLKRIKTAGLTPYGDYYANKKLQGMMLTHDQREEAAQRIAAQKAADRRKYGK